MSEYVYRFTRLGVVGSRLTQKVSTSDLAYVKSGNLTIEVFQLITLPFAGEPHPDQLKRCEVCEHCFDDYDIDGIYTPICAVSNESLPHQRTCEHWKHDGHNTETQG